MVLITNTTLLQLFTLHCWIINRSLLAATKLSFVLKNRFDFAGGFAPRSTCNENQYIGFFLVFFVPLCDSSFAEFFQKSRDDSHVYDYVHIRGENIEHSCSDGQNGSCVYSMIAAELSLLPTIKIIISIITIICW